MKAAVCYEFGKPLRIEEIELAEPDEGEVLVKMAATAICHSDIHDVKGELGGELPFVPGHESAGYIEKVGPGVKGLKKGDPVGVSMLGGCGDCYYCNSGMPHLCKTTFAPPKNIRFHNKQGNPIIQQSNVGGFSEYTVVNRSQVVKVPADVPLDRVCLLSCGVITGFGTVVKRTQPKAFQSVVIMGAGGVGINAVQGAAYVGVYPIIVVDTLDSKLELAKKFGATHGVNATAPDAVEQIQNLTDGRGADYVYVTVGSVAAVKQGMAMLAPRGTVVLIGLTPVGQEVGFSPSEIIPSEIQIIAGLMGSTNPKVDTPNLIKAYKAGKLKLDELITGRYKLEDINDAIADSEKGGVIRNVIMFD